MCVPKLGNTGRRRNKFVQCLLNLLISLTTCCTYRACQESNPDGEYVLACKGRVIRFLHQWASTIREPVLEDLSGINSSFLDVSRPLNSQS